MLLGIIPWARGGIIAADQPQPTPSTDDELLKSLQQNPVDEYDRELLGGAKDKSRTPQGKGKQALDGQLKRELGPAAVPADDDSGENPRLRIPRKMRDVQKLLEQQNAGPTTQGLQKQIVADLDRLIEQARKNACQGKPGESKTRQASSRAPVGPPPSKPGTGGPQQTSTRPAAESSPQARKPETRKPDMDQVRQMIKQIWGELPEHERGEVVQPTVDEFLPKYESLIEDFYRELSRGKEKRDRR